MDTGHIKIDDTTDDVLDVFNQYGFATTGMLTDETGHSRPTVTKRLDRLRAAGYVRYIHEPTALMQLVEDPQEE